MQEIKSTRHSVYLCNYHFVFIPKYRKSILGGTVKTDMEDLFIKIAKKYEIEIVAMEIMPDHVHLFVNAPPRYSPAYIIKLFKGTSARFINQKYPELKKDSVSIWTRSYFVSTAGNMSADTVKRYIEDQWKNAKK
ncbi:MAG: IS200/IS605 family transposase [Euryarchaeota archaeon]|nr:IS200/IS605 family transposase [Euryarchaeota archaeon]